MGHALGKLLGNDAIWDTRLLALLNNLELEEYYLNGDEDKTLSMGNCAWPIVAV